MPKTLNQWQMYANQPYFYDDYFGAQKRWEEDKYYSEQEVQELKDARNFYNEEHIKLQKEIEKLQKENEELKQAHERQSKTINLIQAEKDCEWKKKIKTGLDLVFRHYVVSNENKLTDAISKKLILKELNIEE